MKRRTKIILAIGSAGLAVLCLAGMAFAADGAVPGDTLYGLDRAAEHLGLGNGGTQERLQEATALATKGDCEQALIHAAEAVGGAYGEGNGETSANAALLMAANAVSTTNQGETTQVRAQVAEMLQWMASSETAAEDFGQGVTTRARAIAGAVNGDGQAADGSGADDPGNQAQNHNGEAGEPNSEPTGPNDQPGLQAQSGDCDQTQDQSQTQTQDQTQDQERLQDGECVQDGSRNQTQSQSQNSQSAGLGNH